MAILNYKDFLTEADLLPIAIEAKLPAGAPKLSQYLTQATTNLPTAPNFPTALPDLPAVPTLPTLPTLPTIGGMPIRVNRQEASDVGVINASILPMQERNPDVRFLQRHTQVESAGNTFNYK